MRSALSYFPDIYPNEILYSVIARYARHTGTPNNRFLQHELFGFSHATASFDLPIRLDRFVERIPPSRQISAADVIFNNTLFPYYASHTFMSRRQSALAGMRGEDKDVRLTLTVKTPYLKTIKYLRFCPDCLTEMHNLYGELYWRRDQQLPSTFVCIDHRGLLCESRVRVGYGQHKYQYCTFDNCNDSKNFINVFKSQAVIEHLYRIALKGSALLTTAVDAPECVGGPNIYGPRLHTLNLARGSRFNSLGLSTLASGYFRAYAEAWPGLMDANGNCGSWLTATATQGNRALPPICHLLLTDMLSSLPDEIVNHSTTLKQSNITARWPCRNPSSDHFGLPVVGDLRSVHTTKRTTITAYCDCGYVYSRAHGPDGILRQPRLVTYGPSLTDIFKRAITERWTLSRIITTTRLKDMTLRSQSKAAGLGIYLDTIEKQRLLKRKYRKRVAERSNHPQQKPWLIEQKFERSTFKPTKDWDKIDKAWNDRLSEIIASVKAKVPPIRVTIEAVSREAGEPNYLGARLKRLPKTHARLLVEVEDHSAFRLRTRKS